MARSTRPKLIQRLQKPPKDGPESKKRNGTRNRPQKLKDVEVARKKADKKSQVQARQPVFTINFIYVGNVRNDIFVLATCTDAGSLAGIENWC